MNEREAQAQRREMVERHIVARGVTNPDVLSAMRTVPRHLFVPDEQRPFAYRDRPLSIGEGQTISQPYMVAAMTEALGVGAGDRVLEVGTGCGYQAAVLAEVCAHVYSVELLESLARDAAARLRTLRYDNVTLRCGDGALGWAEEAPFDGVMVTCGAEQTPTALLEQLAPGRRLIIPVGPAGGRMLLRRWQKADDGSLSSLDLMEVRFVPLVRPGLSGGEVSD